MAAPQLRAVQQAPPPDRDRLRDAIGAVADSNAAVERAREARDRVHRDHLAALAPLETAKATLREAESQGQQRRLQLLLGDAVEGPTLKELRQAVADAENALRSIAADEVLLDGEITRREEALAAAIRRRLDVIADVMRPTAESMLAAMRAHLTSAAALRAALAAFPVGTLPNQWDAERQPPEFPNLVAKWRGVAAELAADPEAAIPEGTDQ